MNAQMVYAILYTLLQRHEEAVSYYRRAAEQSKGEDLKAFLESLAAYREKLGKEIRGFLESASPVPVPNKSRDEITPLIKKKWTEVEKALQENNRVEVIRVCHQTEQELSDYYRNSLGQQEATAEGIRDLLKQQHDKVLEVTRKTERLETVPKQRNIDFSV